MNHGAAISSFRTPPELNSVPSKQQSLSLRLNHGFEFFTRNVFHLASPLSCNNSIPNIAREKGSSMASMLVSSAEEKNQEYSSQWALGIKLLKATIQ